MLAGSLGIRPIKHKAGTQSPYFWEYVKLIVTLTPEKRPCMGEKWDLLKAKAQRPTKPREFELG